MTATGASSVGKLDDLKWTTSYRHSAEEICTRRTTFKRCVEAATSPRLHPRTGVSGQHETNGVTWYVIG